MDKSKLLAKRANTASGMPEDDVEIVGIGTVRVRGLSRDEVVGAQQITGSSAFERRMISLGMVEPELSESEVGQWQLNSPAGEIEPVSERIRDLSGMGEGASKSDLSRDGAEPES